MKRLTEKIHKFDKNFKNWYFDELCDRTISYKRNNGIAV